MAHQDRPYLAEWWPRVGATLLDFAIVGVAWLMALTVVAVASVPFGDEFGGFSAIVLWLLVATLYFCGLMSRKGHYNGQTLGKQAANIRVVRDNGEPVTFGSAFVRDILLKFVGGNVTFGVGWIIDSLWPLGEREHRALHDLAASTHVVESKLRPYVPQQPAQPLPALAPPIARHYEAARRIQASIHAAVQSAQLPYGDVAREIDGLMQQLWQSAQRANLLHQTLAETPVEQIERRLDELRFEKKPELTEALQEQLAAQRRIKSQLDRYDAEMERIVVELDTVRANIVSVSVSGDFDNQQRLAGTVRELRDEMSAVGEGIEQAYGPR